MRLQQLELRTGDDVTRLRFHERLTMITGIDVADRQGLVEVLLGTLAGEPTIASELALVGATGQRMTVDQTAEGTFHTFHDDGTSALAPSTMLGLSVRELFDLTYVDARRLGLVQMGKAEPKELGDARRALAELSDQLGGARVAKEAAAALESELRSIDEEIRQIDRGRPRRRYARSVLELDALHAERIAVTATPQEEAADRDAAAHLALLRPVAAAWRTSVRRRSDAARAFGDRVRLDEHAMAGALALPDRVPPDLDGLVDDLAAAEAVRATVSAKLAGLMADHLESPTHPDVARLARADQSRLWFLAERAIETAHALEAESLRLGGLTVEGESVPLAAEIESAHDAVESAHGVIEKRRVGVVAAGGAAALGAVALPFAPLVAPLALAGSAAAAYWSVLAPRQQLAEAQGWETAALIRAGVPSYLSFHLRRMEAMQDASLRVELEKATREHRHLMHQWRTLAGDVSPVDALRLEDEVRAYAASVGALDGLGDDVDATRQRLVDEIEPAVEAAREALLAACRPFGIEHTTLAADLVRQLAEVARVAGEQRDLEALEAEEANARARVVEVLGGMGLGLPASPQGADPSCVDRDVTAMLAVAEERGSAAERRVAAREAGRSIAEIDRDIERVDAIVKKDWKPEYGSTFTAADAREPDPDALQQRRDLTAMAWHTATKMVPDVERLADRRAALERRVAILEAQHGEGTAPTKSRITEIERELQHRLARLRHCGTANVPLPLIMDECLVDLRPDAKWTMLDLIDRLSSGAQIVYMTADPDVTVWARRRAAAGSVAFLDPLRQPA